MQNEKLHCEIHIFISCRSFLLYKLMITQLVMKFSLIFVIVFTKAYSQTLS